MDILNNPEAYTCIRSRLEEDICYIQIYRPDANNTINDILISEISEVLNKCEALTKLVVLEGLPEVFCFGADFSDMQSSNSHNPELLYNLWLKFATGPFITVAHVRGKVNAGGIGFVAACDIVICEDKTIFSLSELLFGLMPACVLPFLTRRIGQAKANYLTLMTQPISADKALSWGLVDLVGPNTENLLRIQLLRLRLLSKTAITRYKAYMNKLNNTLEASRTHALDANREVFSDPINMQNITRFVETGKFPWELG